MDFSREISHLMYSDFSFLCECEEDLKISIVACVHTLFWECLPLLQHEYGIREGVKLFKYWREICKLLQRNLKLDQPTIGRGMFQGILMQNFEEKPFKKSCV
jgi:hypothetical protein